MTVWPHSDYSGSDAVRVGRLATDVATASHSKARSAHAYRT
jgi:hypothetical protein